MYRALQFLTATAPVGATARFLYVRRSRPSAMGESYGTVWPVCLFLPTSVLRMAHAKNSAEHA